MMLVKHYICKPCSSVLLIFGRQNNILCLIVRRLYPVHFQSVHCLPTAISTPLHGPSYETLYLYYDMADVYDHGSAFLLLHFALYL